MQYLPAFPQQVYLDTARLGNDRLDVAVNAAVLPYRHGLSTPCGAERSSIVTMLAIGWSCIFALGLLCAATYGQAASSGRTFTVEHDHFVKDGKPTQLISGRYASDSSCDTLESACWITSTACQAEAIARNYALFWACHLQRDHAPNSLTFVVAVYTTTGSLQCIGGTACFEFAPWD